MWLSKYQFSQYLPAASKKEITSKEIESHLVSIPGWEVMTMVRLSRVDIGFWKPHNASTSCMSIHMKRSSPRLYQRKYVTSFNHQWLEVPWQVTVSLTARLSFTKMPFLPILKMDSQSFHKHCTACTTYHHWIIWIVSLPNFKSDSSHRGRRKNSQKWD